MFSFKSLMTFFSPDWMSISGYDHAAQSIAVWRYWARLGCWHSLHGPEGVHMGSASQHPSSYPWVSESPSSPSLYPSPALKVTT